MELNSAELDRYFAQLRKLDVQTFNRILLYAGKRVGLEGERVAAIYPPASGKPLPRVYVRQRKGGGTFVSKFKSDKQQGYFWWAFNNGELDVPYGRTGQLGRSITSEARLVGDGVEVAVGTNLPYAPQVIGNRETQQAQYHWGTWTPLDEALMGAQSALINRLERDLETALSPYFSE